VAGTGVEKGRCALLVQEWETMLGTGRGEGNPSVRHTEREEGKKGRGGGAHAGRARLGGEGEFWCVMDADCSCVLHACLWLELISADVCCMCVCFWGSGSLVGRNDW
jgi:hypothetical protein